MVNGGFNRRVVVHPLTKVPLLFRLPTSSGKGLHGTGLHGKGS